MAKAGLLDIIGLRGHLHQRGNDGLGNRGLRQTIADRISWMNRWTDREEAMLNTSQLSLRLMSPCLTRIPPQNLDKKRAFG